MTSLASGCAKMLRDPHPNDEAEIVSALIVSLDRLAKDHIDCVANDRAHYIEPDLLERLAALGLFGLSIPTEYGGAGLSLWSTCRVVSALARWDRSVATTVGLHAGLGTRGLVVFGAEVLRRRYLPALADGRMIAAFATTESAAGSDLSAIRTRADVDGDTLRIRGDKLFVTNANLASVFTITAATPGLGGRRGHSLIAVERGDPGVSVGAEERKLGLRASSTASLFLDDVRVPVERIIGEGGQGMRHLAHVLAWGRTVMAAGCIGAAQTAIELAVRHVTTRVQFGKPLASFAVVKSQVADLVGTLFAMESIVEHTCAADQDSASFAARSIAAKVFCSEGDWAVCDRVVQLHGGSGFIEDGPVPMLLRDARVTRIFEGANDVLLVHAGTIAATVAHDPPTDGAPIDGAADETQSIVGDYVRTMKASHGIRLMRMQCELHKLGRLAVLREVADSAAVRAGRLGTAEAADLATHVCRTVANQARSIVEQPESDLSDTISARVYARYS